MLHEFDQTAWSDDRRASYMSYDESSSCLLCAAYMSAIGSEECGPLLCALNSDPYGEAVHVGEIDSTPTAQG